MDDNYSQTLKSVGAIVLTLALFLGVGYYVYESLFVPPGPAQTEETIAAAPSAQPATTDQKNPS